MCHERRDQREGMHVGESRKAKVSAKVPALLGIHACSIMSETVKFRIEDRSCRFICV